MVVTAHTQTACSVKMKHFRFNMLLRRVVFAVFNRFLCVPHRLSASSAIYCIAFSALCMNCVQYNACHRRLHVTFHRVRNLLRKYQQQQQSVRILCIGMDKTSSSSIHNRRRRHVQIEKMVKWRLQKKTTFKNSYVVRGLTNYINLSFNRVTKADYRIVSSLKWQLLIIGAYEQRGDQDLIQGNAYTERSPQKWLENHIDQI